jgi:glycerol kinase
VSDSLIAVIDQGSTQTKGALLDLEGRTLRQLAKPVEKRIRNERHEHDAARIADDVEEILGQLLSDSRVACIGFTCQRSTCLVWERESGVPLGPALSWQDRSQHHRMDALEARASEVAERTGLLLSPHYAAAKLAALLDETGGRGRAEDGSLIAGTLDAFLIQRLTGRASTEPGHAGRTLLYNLTTGEWDARLLDIFGVPAAALPGLVPSAAARGAYRGVPLTAVAGDQQAALLGHGGWRRGVSAAHFGTGAFVLSSTGSQEIRHPGLLSAVLASTAADAGEIRRFQLEGSVNSAGSAVDWACRLSGERLEEWSDRKLDFDHLPLVLPAFSGVAAPWWRPAARAALSGLTLDTEPSEILAATLAGVAMRIVDCLEALAEAGAAPDVLRVSGKLTRLSGLTQLIADAAQLPVEISADEESGLTGIARLAALGAGLGDEGLQGRPPARQSLEPSWPPPRAASARERWLSFVNKSLEI